VAIAPRSTGPVRKRSRSLTRGEITVCPDSSECVVCGLATDEDCQAPSSAGNDVALGEREGRALWRLGQTPGANSARTNASRRRGSARHPSLEIAAVAEVPHDSGVKLLIRYASSRATGCQL
jgi:hypothetical protein